MRIRVVSPFRKATSCAGSVASCGAMSAAMSASPISTTVFGVGGNADAGGIPFDELHRPGANRRPAHRVIGPVGRGDGDKAEHRWHQHLTRVSRYVDGVVIDHGGGQGDALDLGPVAAGQRLVLKPADGFGDRVGVERRAVVKFDAFARRDPPDAVALVGSGGGKARLDFTGVAIDRGQCFGKVFLDDDADIADGAVAGVDVDGFGGRHNAQRGFLRMKRPGPQAGCDGNAQPPVQSP